MEALRQFLNRTGMSAADFGNWMKPPVSGRTVQRWLAGTHRPSAEQCVEIYRLTKGAVRFEDFHKLPKISEAAK